MSLAFDDSCLKIDQLCIVVVLLCYRIKSLLLVCCTHFIMH